MWSRRKDEGKATPEQQKHSIGRLLVIVGVFLAVFAFTRYRAETDRVNTQHDMAGFVEDVSGDASLSGTLPRDEPHQAGAYLEGGVGGVLFLAGVILIAGSREDRDVTPSP